MAEESKTSGSRGTGGEKQTQAEVKEEREAAKYSPEQLRAEARARFDVSPHVVAGALSAGSKKTYTVDEARALVERFQKTKLEDAK